MRALAKGDKFYRAHRRLGYLRIGIVCGGHPYLTPLAVHGGRRGPRARSVEARSLSFPTFDDGGGVARAKATLPPRAAAAGAEASRVTACTGTPTGARRGSR